MHLIKKCCGLFCRIVVFFNKLIYFNSIVALAFFFLVYFAKVCITLYNVKFYKRVLTVSFPRRMHYYILHICYLTFCINKRKMFSFYVLAVIIATFKILVKKIYFSRKIFYNTYSHNMNEM